jgi:hypothetical protein
MKNLLSEEIERYRRLSNYNPKLTLTENVELISEQRTLATTVREIESILGKDIHAIMNEFKMGTMDAATITKLLQKDAKSFEKEILKAFGEDIKAGYPKGTLGPLGKELSKVELLRRISNEVKSKGRALTKPEMEALAKEVAANNKLKAAKFEPTIKPVKPKPNPAEEEEALKIITKDPTKKGLNWKSLLKWGTITGVSIGTLYAIYKMTHDDEPPIVTTDEVTPSPTPTNGGGGGGGGSRYTSCSETFPIAQYCKNEKIREIQGCLGVSTDGKFGPKTGAALAAKGVSGTEITQDSYNKVCNKQTNTVDPDIEDVDAVNPNDI